MVATLDTLAGHIDWLMGWVRIGTVEVGVMNESVPRMGPEIGCN